jgi:uncharacterized membrane protein YfcA
MTLGHVVLLLVAGVAAGAVNGVAGGGTLLSFPALLVVGLSPVSANVTNTVALWPGYVSGAFTFRGELSHDFAQQRRLTGVAGAGAALGTVVLLTAPAAIFHTIVPYLVLGATGLLAAQPSISRALTRRRSRRSTSGPGPAPLIAGVFAGAVYGAYFGGGLGIVLVAILALGLEADLQRVTALKSLLALVVNTVALLGFVVFGPVDWVAAAIIAPASVLGGVLGARLAQRLDPRALRAAVVLLGCAVSIRMLTA